MKKTLIIIFSIFLSLNIFLAAKAQTGAADKFFNTIHAIMLCGTGSTATACKNPAVLGSTTDGTTFDLGSVTAGASAGSLGNLGKAPPGQTYSFMQVILSKTFQIEGSAVNAGSTTCYTASVANSGTATTGTTQSIGHATSSNKSLQIVTIAEDATLDTNMHGTNNLDGSTTGDAANADAGDNTYVAFISELTAPFTMKPGVIPQMKIAFDLSAAVNFPAGGSNCTVSPATPVVTVTFLN